MPRRSMRSLSEERAFSALSHSLFPALSLLLVLFIRQCCASANERARSGAAGERKRKQEQEGESKSKRKRARASKRDEALRALLFSG